MKNYIIYAIILLSTVITSCKQEENANAKEDQVVIVQGNSIQVSTAQFNAEGMKLGEMKTIKFDEEVSCNGYIKASRNGLAKVGTHIPGIVESINYSIGDFVKKGQVLCTLSSTEFISLQENFIITSAKLKVAKRNFERNKELYNQNVGSEKEYNNAESEFKSVMANYNSLKKRLEILKLNTSRIENGKLYSLLPIYSPINGYVANRTIVLGEYIDTQKSIMEIVDNNSLQLVLSIFEKDIAKLKINQKVKFNNIDNNSEFSAEISSIGKTIDEKSKTIQCIAQIENINNYNFVNKSYIDAKIQVNNKMV